MPELKIYTVADLREWSENNHPVEGLSERMIAPTRAWALVNHPYVKNEDAIVAAIFEDGELAAYTTSIPDKLDGKRVWWASALYCYPKFTGRGYGLIVVGSLMEAHEPELTYDRWAAKETVEIFSHFGYQTTYTKRYRLSDKKIDASNIKGKLAHYAQSIKKALHPWSTPSKTGYTLRYASFIDGEAYAFIKANRGNDLWVREQEMLNWILRYPLGQGCVLMNRVERETQFSAYVPSYEYKVVKEYEDEQLIGVYVLRLCDATFSVVYLYYIDENRDVVFTSIVDHIVSIRPKTVLTENKDLMIYVKNRLYFPKMEEEMISLSLPDNSNKLANFTLQLGDGDSFA